MRFHVRSYRNGSQLLRGAGAFDEVCDALSSISVAEVAEIRERIRRERAAEAEGKGGRPRTAGIQIGLNRLLDERLKGRGWARQVPVFRPDPRTSKGFWTIDFVKLFPSTSARVGLEVTFNHGEALTWTPLRLTLAHEAEDVLPDARVNVGCIVMGTDHLKGSRRMGLRMDSAVGTYERMLTVLPKMRSVLPAPLVLFGLDWADGGLAEPPEEIDLHTSSVAARRVLSS